jgi:thiol:disulfide interchange protein
MDALLLGLAGVVALSLLLFGVGQRQHDGARVIWAVPVALAVAGGLFAVTPARHHSASNAAVGDSRWSEAAVAQAQAAGRPVFVYFTADWCLTCKVNEAAAIDRAEVRDAFAKAGVTVLAGDWTDGDPAITRFLESRGRAGVPYYLWYVPGKPPEELPQLLTPSMLISRAQAVPQR